MPISGLVLTFDRDISDHPKTVAELEKSGAIEVGERNATKLAIVVDTETKEEDQKIWQWVHQLPGVTSVSVAFVAFDGEDSVENQALD